MIATMKATKVPEAPKYNMIRRVISVAYHRNGVTGWPFYVVLFEYRDEDGKMRRMMATVSVTDADAHASKMVHAAQQDRVVAVVDIDRAAAGAIGQSLEEKYANRWRGDHFQRDLELAIRAHQTAEDERFDRENRAAARAKAKAHALAAKPAPKAKPVKVTKF